MLTLSPKKQYAINVSAGLVYFVLNFVISFFLSPFIVRTLGVEANGFIQLANNFIQYASIIMVAINSMSSRFIAIAIHQNDFDKARTYYSSSFAGNVLILSVLFLPIVSLIVFLQYVIAIPAGMVFAVKLLFALIFLNFYISSGTPDFASAVFTKNVLYLQSVGNILGSIIRLVGIFALFGLLTPQIWYPALIAVVISVALNIWLLVIKNKLLPNLKISRSNIKRKELFEIVSTGFWNMINNVGTQLSMGLDLLICNLIIGAQPMGVLSVVRIVPGILGSLIWTLTANFTPNFTRLYAEGKKEEIVNEVKNSSKVILFIGTIPYVGFLGFGQSFFKLWMPTLNTNELFMLSGISLIGFIFTFNLLLLNQLFTTVNRTKEPAIASVVTGMLTIIAEIVLIKYTSLGILGICISSAFFNLLRDVCFTLPFAASVLGVQKRMFISLLTNNVMHVVILSVVAFGLHALLAVNSWIGLLLGASLFAVIAITFNFFTLLQKSQRALLLRKVRGFVTR